VNAAFGPYAVGRALIALIALLTAVSPWTQYYWHFDNFPHGGDDFELGAFSVAIVVCLILVMLQNRNRGFLLVLAVRARSFFARHDKDNSTPCLPCDRVKESKKYVDLSRFMGQWASGGSGRITQPIGDDQNRLWTSRKMLRPDSTPVDPSCRGADAVPNSK